MTTVKNAASLMGRRSAQVRIKRWGKREFVAKMREWGKLGGRPIGSGKKQRSKRGVKSVSTNAAATKWARTRRAVGAASAARAAFIGTNSCGRESPSASPQSRNDKVARNIES